MSSPEPLIVENDYGVYSLEWFEEGTPLITKAARLLAAATQNDIETLKNLLDAPKWYKVRDINSFNLLHVAVLKRHDDIFDYLLSLDDFPLEDVDDKGSTALVIALSYCRNNYRFTSDHRNRYASDLIKKGANIDIINERGDTLLHIALAMDCLGVAQLLIERGADLNAQNARGDTPLHICTECHLHKVDEAVTMLLCYGADPSICSNEGHTPLHLFLNFRANAVIAQENLFYFTIDEWSSCEISAEVLAMLARNKSPLFQQLVQFPNLFFVDNSSGFSGLQFCTIGEEYLRVLLRKRSRLMKKFFLCSHSGFASCNIGYCELFDLKNLDMLLQSSFRSDVVEFISTIHSSTFFSMFLHSGLRNRKILEMIYYFLSYGMVLHAVDFEKIYQITDGYSEDFKNFLLMDVDERTTDQITAFMPRLICDISLDLHEVVQDPCDFIDWHRIFDYFAHPKIQNAYHVIKNCEIIRRELPQVPLLQELARDAFRRYFIKLFKIATTKQFFSLINSLPISSAHKKIITFESKLY